MAFVAECTKSSSLDYAVKIGFYRLNGRFPKQTDDIASRAIDYIADQVLSTDTKWILPPSRTETRRQEEILKYFGLSEFGPDEVKRLLLRSKSSMVYAAMSYEEYETDVLHWCFSENMRAPQRTFIRRTHKALRENYAKSEYIRITQKIGNEGQRELLASVRGDSIAPSIIDLRDEPGKTNRKNFRAIARKLSFIESLELPHRYIEKLDPKFLEMESRRIAKLKPAEIRRFSREKQISLLSVYLVTHQPTMTDTFVDMLIEAVHKIRTKSEREVGRMVARQTRQICDAEAALISLLKIGKETPEKPIGEAIAEIMSVPTMDAFLAQKSEKVPYAKSVFTLMHNRWKFTTGLCCKLYFKQ